jgi:hypothetical protein
MVHILYSFQILLNPEFSVSFFRQAQIACKKKNSFAFLTYNFFFFSMANRSDIGEITANNLGQVKVLHKTLFPVSYSENFYKDLLEAGPFAKLGKESGRDERICIDDLL